MKFLVTGGAGFVGSHLVELLLKNGQDVRIIDDFSSGHRSNLKAVESEAEIIEGSLLDPKLLQHSAKGVNGIFHLAAVVSVPVSIERPEFAHEVNLTGTLNVLEVARAQKCPLVFSSSAAIYGNPNRTPVSETDATQPISPYGVQKLAAEYYGACYHHLFQVPFIALRYFNIFGPRQDPKSPYSGVITAFANRALAAQPLTINGDGMQTRDFIYVNDVAEANWLAMQTALKEEAYHQLFAPMNIGTGIETTLNDLAHEIVLASGTEAPIIHGPERIGDIRLSLADPHLACEVIGFKSTIGLKEGIHATIEHFRTESPGS